MPRTKTTAPKKTAYQKLVAAKASFCKGNTTKTAVKKIARAYVLNAIKKATKEVPAGKKVTAARAAKKAAEKIANGILKKGCAVSAYIAGKKKPAKRKAAARRRK